MSDDDDTPTATQAAADARALRGAAKLAFEATTGLTDLVEAMHARIATLPGFGSADGRTRGITGLVYRTIRGVTRAVGGSVDAVLPVLAPLLASSASPGLPSPEREAVLAALNGVMGDHLARSANPLAIRMALRRDGRALTLQRDALAAALPDAGERVLVLVHGLCMNDLQWRRDGHDHGAALAESLGFTPVYLHYNTGLHVSTNGRALANLLEQLLAQWPRPVARFAIVGHSMGGLVTRSALHYGRAAGLHWVDRLDDLACLGTPHHGAPLERAGQGIHMLLDATPYAGPFGRLARLRSAGITDLRHGNLVDEDWLGADRFAGTTDRRQPVPLPAGPRCFALAGTLAGAGKALGDGLVPLASALGKHRLARRALKFAPSNQRVLEDTNHMQLLASAAVFEQLRDWLRH